MIIPIGPVKPVQLDVPVVLRPTNAKVVNLTDTSSTKPMPIQSAPSSALSVRLVPQLVFSTVRSVTTTSVLSVTIHST
jgi:hypothetical protein